MEKFKTYIGTKTIKAMPMKKEEAEKILGKSITPAAAGNDGYLVEYADGYQSWSPKYVFKEAYKVAETPVDRMNIELDELNDRICKCITALFHSESPLRLDTFGASWHALHDQVKVMLQYAELLHKRIVLTDNDYEINITNTDEKEDSNDAVD